MTRRILTTKPNPELLVLPWDTPLEEWGEEHVIQLPRGLSRHVVRFVRVGKYTCAVKETDELIARREYHLLRDLQKLGLPCVVPQAVVTGRKDKSGEWLPVRTGDAPPAVLAAVPLAVHARHARGQPAAARRRPRGAPGAAAPGRLLLGRRLAVERPVPAQRR